MQPADIYRSQNLGTNAIHYAAYRVLAEMARARPASLSALGAVSGVGAKKLEAYGPEILRVLGS